MASPTRRNFFKDLGLGGTAFSLAARPLSGTQLPGGPSSGAAESRASAAPKIMAIAAHPGDAFFAMGAPVALHVHRGGQGNFLSLSLGEKGSSTIPPVHYGTLQREASQRAAGMLTAHASFLTYPDGLIPADDEAKFAVCDMIREHEPEIVVTHWRGSWHKDHRACYEVVNDAIFYAALPAVARKHPAHSVEKLFFADNWEDADSFKADTYLDITPVYQRWVGACAAFPMWRGENGFRYHDYYRSLAIERGCRSGFQYAVALMSPPEQLTRHVHAL
ncbi:MAG: PIG-L deacetylase family protein [Bryobacteraceae bacterium]